MSEAVRYLTSLCSLSIGNCEEFDPLRDMHDDGMEWRCLNCLRDLSFSGIPKLKSLPVGLQCISTLKELRIPNCPNLMTLPELTSLEYLWICRCEPNLTSLLEISCLTSLRWLWIEDLPNLITFPESISGETTAANGSTSSSATATPLFHLLLGNYLKNLNKFLGQYGHGINHLDSFKIWEVDAAKTIVCDLQSESILQLCSLAWIKITTRH
nr:hypothetical protein CFP56_15165 [Quercus suber]